MSGLIASSESRMIFGLGLSGLSVARFWREAGIPFLAADTREAAAQAESVREAIGAGTELYAGDFALEIVDGITELVVSPGIALDHPLVCRAREQGTRVIGDIDLFVAKAKAPVVGITGSNGKSTVTALLGAMAQTCGIKVAVGGNIGTPALELLDDDVELYIVELSSFQLERAEPLNLEVATVLNVSADHLDRHGTLPLYHQAKHRIFAGAKKIVANRADPLTIPLLQAPADVLFWRPSEPDLKEFGVRVIDHEPFLSLGHTALISAAELPLEGLHNIGNALAALALGSAVGLDTDAMLTALREFTGLAHRCERVAEAAGVVWINDSKATNVGATAAALEGLGGSANVILLAGGEGKGQDFAPLAALAERYCKRVMTFGAAARELEVALGARVPCQRVATLEKAVNKAAALAESGDVVLLSPSCASFDQFANYEARGDAFKRSVLALVGESSS